MIKMSFDSSALSELVKLHPEVLVDIKKGVVENFTAKAIKPLLNIPELKQIVEDTKQTEKAAFEFIKLAIVQEIAKQIGKVVTSKGYWGKDTIELQDSIKEKVAQSARLIVTSELHSIVTKQAQEVLDRETTYLTHHIDNYLKDVIRSLVSKEIDRRLKLTK